MATTECGRGHIYDSDIYPSCPYCSNAQPVINFDRTVRGDADRVPPRGARPAAYVEDRTAPVEGVTVGRDQVRAATSVMEDDGVTRPPRDYARARRVDEEQHTVGTMSQRLGVEPVVGWLVCVEGPDKGRAYELWGRINTIGRSEHMDVRIKGDLSISKENHARLGYDPKNNRFRLIPADSINNIYLNDDVIDMPTQLHPYDVIEFGETKLVFVPFCSQRFTWEKGIIPPEGDKEA